MSVIDKFSDLMIYDYAVSSLKKHLHEHVRKTYNEYLKKHNIILGCYPHDWDIDYIEDENNTLKLTEIIFYTDCDRLDVLISIPIEEFI